MVNYKETIMTEPDSEEKVLTALAEGSPYAFLVCRIDSETEELDLRVSLGGGLDSAGGLRALLEQTLRALP